MGCRRLASRFDRFAQGFYRLTWKGYSRASHINACYPDVQRRSRRFRPNLSGLGFDNPNVAHAPNHFASLSRRRVDRGNLNRLLSLCASRCCSVCDDWAYRYECRLYGLCDLSPACDPFDRGQKHNAKAHRKMVCKFRFAGVASVFWLGVGIVAFV